MAFEIQYEMNGVGVVVTASGHVDASDVHATFDQVWRRPESSLLRYHLIQVLEGSTFSPSFSELREIGKLVPETLKYSPGVCTILVTNNLAMMSTLGIASAFARALAKGPRLHLCWTMQEARGWIRKECPDLFPE